MFYSFGKQGNEVSGAVMGTICRIAPSIFILQLPSRFMHFTIALKTLFLLFCYLYLYLKLYLYLYLTDLSYNFPQGLCTCSQLLLFSLIKNIKTLQEMLFLFSLCRQKEENLEFQFGFFTPGFKSLGTKLLSLPLPDLTFESPFKIFIY